MLVQMNDVMHGDGIQVQKTESHGKQEAKLGVKKAVQDLKGLHLQSYVTNIILFFFSPYLNHHNVWICIEYTKT